MAPSKRKAAGDESTPAKVSTRITTRASEAANRRRTRSSSKGSSDAKLAVKPPARKKPAKARKKNKSEKKKEEQVEEEVKSDGGEEAKAEDAAEEAVKASKTVVIERWASWIEYHGEVVRACYYPALHACNSFKTRAEQVRVALENVAGIIVTINPVKPRRGCFEIREEGGETFISLLNMKRPFKLMKDLNMQELIDDIIQKIQ